MEHRRYMETAALELQNATRASRARQWKPI